MRETSRHICTRFAEDRGCRACGAARFRRCQAVVRTLRRLCVASAPLFAAACKSDQQKAGENRQSIQSWQSTMRMADSAAARHELPARFLARVRATAHEEIAKASKP